MFYAHTKKDADNAVLPKEQWQPLEDHLNAVADFAACFAGQFQLKEFGRAIGMLHDYGKASLEFKRRLEGAREHVDHATKGAQKAMDCYGGSVGKLLAYGICGHHGGLPDDIGISEKSGLCERLKAKVPEVGDYQLNLPPVQAMQLKLSNTSQYGMSVSLLIRMLFSCLVDGDYLDTERFMQPEKAAMRGGFADLDALYLRFRPMKDKLLHMPQNSNINIARRQVLNACLTAAENASGIFSLTVPTGGGKTLSSLAFAFEHAQKYRKKRIIYAIPYTSIIEQTSDVFRSVLGADAVLEHHSNILHDGNDEYNVNRLASENWDAGLVVTTNVQLFESLFAAKPSRARKLHNLANSIIILDEAQMLPDPLLRPCLAALKCLCADYGATVVFCTATQPAIKPRWLDSTMPPDEIIPDPAALYLQLQRTEVSNLGYISDEQLASMLAKHEQALCIVNTRAHARRLYEKLAPNEGIFHLSALMCPQHRTQVLAEIKRRLKEGLSCLVISTQLIEAGVDIDFPVVYRSLAGIDSIAQAAGRCNREGKMKTGKVYVFEPEGGLPKGWFSRMAGFAREVMALHENPLLPLSVESFFNKRYMQEDYLDEMGILRSLNDGAGKISFQFSQIAKDFKFIDSTATTLVIPYDAYAREQIEQARHGKYPGQFCRKLQRYSVSIYPHEYEQLYKGGYIQTILDGAIHILAVNDLEFEQVYHPKLGLNVKPESGLLLV
ncbi:CRISPR-associated helicase Cas3' [Desulforamulus ruminis]|uniref:CRISPR-associated helicase Cas3' n=1 Tax=Desulforamulus ruminis TaxID=1564 RepID=UPI002FDA309C